MKEFLKEMYFTLEHYRIIFVLKMMIRFILDLIIVLAMATLVMRFFIICGTGQDLSLLFGMFSGIGANFYVKFRHKLL